MSDTTTNPAEKPINDGGTTPQSQPEPTEAPEAAETEPSEESGSE
jgi:hypothetical protein